MPHFIAIEGLDGSGTSTQAQALAQALNERGEAADATFEPSEGAVGRLIRKYLVGDLKSADEEKADRNFLAYLFAADRQDHLENQESGIKAAIAAGRHVVCARYVMSSYAYEGDDAAELEFVKKLNDSFLLPDLVLYLDCPVEVSLARLQSTRDRLDIFENRQKLERVRAGYLRAMESWPGPVLVCDATREAAAITAEALEVLDLGHSE
ncbi:MAG: dTMP kinase [Planctomycetota bacterium]